MPAVATPASVRLEPAVVLGKRVAGAVDEAMVDELAEQMLEELAKLAG